MRLSCTVHFADSLAQRDFKRSQLGLKVLLKFLFISGDVLNSSFPSELVISFQPAECQLLSQQQRVTSVSPDACQQPLTCHFFIPHIWNAWRGRGYSFPTDRHTTPEPKCGVQNHSSWNVTQSRLPRSHLPQCAIFGDCAICLAGEGDLNQCVHMALGPTPFSAAVQPLHLVLCLI